MGKRDYRHRESKKPKKDTKNIPALTALSPSVNVEVVKKGKKHREGEDKEETG